jgi:hypothetical protein
LPEAETIKNIPKGFLSARWIPVFLKSGWVFSLLFEALVRPYVKDCFRIAAKVMTVERGRLDLSMTETV